MKWISVEERLPEKDCLYLCCGHAIEWSMRDEAPPDSTFTAYFYEGRWQERTSRYEDVTITHWMPLPDLPKE